ncbi:MAG: FliI/YscN family ATPase [Bdellovibrionota bacterium]
MTRRNVSTPDILSIIPEMNLEPFYEKLETQHAMPLTMRGRVRRITGMVVKARLPNAKIGEMCTIEPPGRPPVNAQVVGFDDEDVFLTPLDPLDEIGPKTPVISKGRSLRVGVGPQLLGRVVNSLGEPIDKKGTIGTTEFYSVRHPAPEAMERRRITKVLPVGIRAVDSLMTIGEGQRMGVFSAAGVGKSSLLGMIARNSTADVNVVALVGERGREVLDFLDENLGPHGLSKSVVVVSTSDEPPLRRILAAYTATAIAEYFRDQGKRVMLLMDSVTRFARALREIALSVGEPPVRQGYPPSVFAALPELLERAGSTETGSITAFYTILLASEQIEDPLGEEIRAILDGHLYLSSKLSYAQHYPAIDLLRSNSRVMQGIVTAEHRELAETIRKLWATYEDNRDLISLGAYKKGNDPEIDQAIAKRGQLIKFLVQSPGESDDLSQTLEKAKTVLKS